MCHQESGFLVCSESGIRIYRNKTVSSLFKLSIFRLVARPSRRHWVIGDVHGCYASLLELLTVLPKRDHLVFCGDVIDRGPNIEASMHLVWDLTQSGRATWLRGNHEQALIDALQQSSTSSGVLLHQDTYRQLGDGVCRQWLPRLNQLPLVYQAQDWIATHAGFSETGEPDLSIRESFWETYDGRFGRVVIGHTPRPCVERNDCFVSVDTGAVYGGMLSAFCPETDAVVQVQGARDSSPVPDPRRLDPLLSRARRQGDQITC